MDLETITKFNSWWSSGRVPEPLLGRFKRPGFKAAKSYLDKRFIVLLYGLRRTGKTTAMYQVISELLNSGANPYAILYFSFDEQIAELREIIEIYEEKILKKRIKDVGKIFFFFDEIQKLADWETKIKLIYDLQPNLKIYISGSASVALRKTAKESLAGRIIDIFFRPLSFKEFLEWKGLKFDQSRLELFGEEIKPHLMDYFRKGGFPEIVNEENEEIIRAYIKNTVLERLIHRDLPREFGLKDTELLNNLLQLFLKEPGRILNLDSLSRDFKKSKITIGNYLEYLRYGLLIREVKSFRAGFLTASRKRKKIYPASTAFSFAYNFDFYSNDFLSKAAETVVADYLGAEFYYRNSFEVDFLALVKGQKIPVEVKYGDKTADTIQLQKYLKKFSAKRAVLITKNEISPAKDNIKKLPLWLFLLREPIV